MARAAREDRIERGHDRPHRDSRNQFERDRDRVLYSSAFRRLAGVTQVVLADQGHAFHNRLTHSLKVAQIGRRLAVDIRQTLAKTNSPQAVERDYGGVDPDVAEVACLAHDLGHPPFGHAGEAQLSQEIDRIGRALGGFEGNAQSFRIVTIVAAKSNQPSGLNLTRASLNAILKYPWLRAENGKRRSKWGCYATEAHHFEFARALSPDGSDEPSLEAQLMDWADDVSYAVHDLDDFYRAGLVPLHEILRGDSAREHFLSHEVVQAALGKTKSSRSQAEDFLDFLARVMADKTILESFKGTRNQRADLHNFSSLLIARFLRVDRKSPDEAILGIEPRDGSARLQIDPQLKFEVEILKQLPVVYVFNNPVLLAQQVGQKKIIAGLFRVFWAAAGQHAPARGLYPEPFRSDLAELDRCTGDELEPRIRVTCDFISSLNERQAIELYRVVTGAETGSTIAPIVW